MLLYSTWMVTWISSFYANSTVVYCVLNSVDFELWKFALMKSCREKFLVSCCSSQKYISLYFWSWEFVGLQANFEQQPTNKDSLFFSVKSNFTHSCFINLFHVRHMIFFLYGFTILLFFWVFFPMCFMKIADFHFK